MTFQQVMAGVAVVMALEGLLYAAFPDAMRRTLSGIIALPPERLRVVGLVVAAAGIAIASMLAHS